MTWLPVAANHYRTVTGNIENWQYRTYASLSLPGNERLEALIIDRETHTFGILQKRRAPAPSTSADGGRVRLRIRRRRSSATGPDDRQDRRVRRVRRGGRTGGVYTRERAGSGAWVRSTAADRTQELTLDELKVLSRTGMVG